jgi:hypothetical protein
MVMNIKKCYKCGMEKNIDEFTKWSYSNDGRKGICRQCSSVIGKEIYKNKVKKEEQRVRICKMCGIEFSYIINRGADKKHCSPECREKYKIKKKKERQESLPLCNVGGCTKKATRIEAGMCEVHFYRLRRTGSTDKKQKKGKYVDKHGYVKLRLKDHPLSEKESKMVYEHRKILYDKYKNMEMECFWCGKKLTWNIAITDHLNEIKDENTFENLVMSCNKCNRARGGMLHFIRGMKKESFGVFVDLCRIQMMLKYKNNNDGGY